MLFGRLGGGAPPPAPPPPPPPPPPTVLETLTTRPTRAAMALAWVGFSVYVAAFRRAVHRTVHRIVHRAAQCVVHHSLRSTRLTTWTWNALRAAARGNLSLSLTSLTTLTLTMHIALTQPRIQPGRIRPFARVGRQPAHRACHRGTQLAQPDFLLHLQLSWPHPRDQPGATAAGCTRAGAAADGALRWRVLRARLRRHRTVPRAPRAARRADLTRRAGLLPAFRHGVTPLWRRPRRVRRRTGLRAAHDE